MKKTNVVADSTQSRIEKLLKTREVETSITVSPEIDGGFPSLAPHEINADPYAGHVAANGKLILPVFAPPGERSVQTQIDTGRSMDTSDGVITYGFYVGNHAVGLNNNPSFGEGKGYSPFTEEQKIAAAAAVETWDDLVAAEFVNVGDVGVKGWAQGSSDILLANTTTGPLQAWAYGPGYGRQYERVSGDVWIADPTVQPDNGWFGFGEYGATTLIHELGHSLGFTHPGAYNGSGATTYKDQAEYFQDSGQYTIMSYWSPSQTGARMYDFQNSGGLFDLPAQTPLLHDIALIQAKYGADAETRVTATTYGFNATAGNQLYDFSQNLLPHLSIYDAGGVDTIDLSGYTMSQVVDLNPGAFSSIGETDKTFTEMGQDLHDVYLELFGIDLYTTKQADGTFYMPEELVGLSQGWYNSSLTFSEASHEAYTGFSDLFTIAYDNFSIAYNTEIENAIGGQGRDLLKGNHLANMLDGQAGDDILMGGAGDDMLTGGAGADMFVYGAADAGLDTINDFVSGVDSLDLREFAIGAADVSFSDGVLSVNTDGNAEYDLMINIQGTFSTSDILFV